MKTSGTSLSADLWLHAREGPMAALWHAMESFRKDDPMAFTRLEELYTKCWRADDAAVRLVPSTGIDVIDHILRDVRELARYANATSVTGDDEDKLLVIQNAMNATSFVLATPAGTHHIK